MADIFIKYPGDKNTPIGPFNCCIYCGNNETNRTDEHAVPEALGGRLILKNASCPTCQKAIDPFESRCHNQMFAAVRAHLGFKTTKSQGRKGRYPVSVTRGGKREKVLIPIEDHPTMLHLVSFAPPGILFDQPPSKDFKDTRWWAWSLGEQHEFDGKLGRLQKTINFAEIRLDGVFLANSFGRYLAKIAHCSAIAHFGLDSFRPMLLDIILKEDAPVAYLVGCESAGMPAHEKAPHFELSFGCMADLQTNHILLCATVRLFAWLETPIYLIVIGEPGPKILRELTNM